MTCRRPDGCATRDGSAAGLSSGVPVRAGEVLARLVNTDAESGLVRGEAAPDGGGVGARALPAGLRPRAWSRRRSSLLQGGGGPGRQRLAAARQKRRDLDLRSPVSGWLLVERRLPPEAEVPAGTVLARVAAGGRRGSRRGRRRGTAPASTPGLAVRFVVPGTPGAAGRGAIREISPDAGGGRHRRPWWRRSTAGAGLPAPGEGVEMHVELDPRPARADRARGGARGLRRGRRPLRGRGGNGPPAAGGDRRPREAAGSRSSAASRRATRWWWAAPPCSPKGTRWTRGRGAARLKDGEESQ